ncbi:DegT/DnrJ/EryC1/StrS family aminotransferase [Desulfosoma sp.]
MATNAFLPVARPWIDEREVQAVRRVLESGWLTQGPMVEAFEREFAQFVQTPYACAVSSCTTALHLALRAVGVGPGDEVITVSHSFIATANSIRYCGAVPVFADIEPGTFNLDPTCLDSLISQRTKAVLCVHQMGMPCDMARIVPWARAHGLAVIEDAACAIGSEIFWDGRWEKIGKPHGDAACFSFHPRKLLTTGDGGMITTARKDIDEKCRLWRHHGMSVPDAVRHASPHVVFESYETLGFNYRMTDIQAAVGREQLRKIPQIVSRRRLQVQRYREMLNSVVNIVFPEEPPWARSNWQSLCVRLPVVCDQAKVMQFLLEKGIATRRGIMCAHREPAYFQEPWSCGLGPGACGCPPGTCKRLKHSEEAQDRGLILPLFHDLTEEDQRRVVETLQEACARC